MLNTIFRGWVRIILLLLMVLEGLNYSCSGLWSLYLVEMRRVRGEGGRVGKAWIWRDIEEGVDNRIVSCCSERKRSTGLPV